MLHHTAHAHCLGVMDCLDNVHALNIIFEISKTEVIALILTEHVFDEYNA